MAIYQGISGDGFDSYRYPFGEIRGCYRVNRDGEHEFRCIVSPNVINLLEIFGQICDIAKEFEPGFEHKPTDITSMFIDALEFALITTMDTIKEKLQDELEKRDEDNRVEELRDMIKTRDDIIRQLKLQLKWEGVHVDD